MLLPLALSCTLLCPQWTPDQPEPEPTADETLGLEWVNRFRAAPAKEGALLMERAFPRDAFPGFYREMFLAEVQALEPAPPVFFHTRLIAAARNHASYTVLNSKGQEFGHKEVEGRPGFTGEWSHQRAAAVGYPSTHGLVGESAGAYIHGGIYGTTGSISWTMGRVVPVACKRGVVTGPSLSTLAIESSEWAALCVRMAVGTTCKFLGKARAHDWWAASLS